MNALLYDFGRCNLYALTSDADYLSATTAAKQVKYKELICQKDERLDTSRSARLTIG
jgi:hypothetical protein